MIIYYNGNEIKIIIPHIIIYYTSGKLIKYKQPQSLSFSLR